MNFGPKLAPKRLHIIHRMILPLILIASIVSLSYAEPRDIRILHINDFHGFAEPHKVKGEVEPVGGIAYLASRAKDLRLEKPTLLLSAGDMIRGNVWTDYFKGEPVIRVMNIMGFDAMVVGNHEFDFGMHVLAKRIGEAGFPVLGVNVEGMDGLRPYMVREVNGIRVGIIGVITEELQSLTGPGNTAGLRVMPVRQAVRQILDELKGRVDLVVLLSHMGYQEDRSVAADISGLNVIVGGHTHTRLQRPETVDNTVIVQAWEHGKALGVLDLTVDEGRVVKAVGHIEEISPSAIKPDSDVEAIVKEYSGKLDALFGESIGTVGNDLDAADVRIRETELGDLLADAVRQAAGTDAAIINAGAIRAGLHKGAVSLRDMMSLLPFDNGIVILRLTGMQLKAVLEHGVSAIEKGEGRFPQVSGLVFSYQLSAPAYARVRKVEIGGAELDPEKIYTLAINSFIAGGGDGYGIFKDIIREKEGNDSVSYRPVESPGVRDAVIEYIRTGKNITVNTGKRIIELP